MRINQTPAADTAAGTVNLVLDALTDAVRETVFVDGPNAATTQAVIATAVATLANVLAFDATPAADLLHWACLVPSGADECGQIDAAFDTTDPAVHA